MSTLFANEIEPIHAYVIPMRAPFMQSGKVDRAPVFGNTLRVSSAAVPERSYSIGLQAIAVVALALIIFGLIVGYLKPGPITGLALPAGLTMWLLLGYLAREADSK